MDFRNITEMSKDLTEQLLFSDICLSNLQLDAVVTAVAKEHPGEKPEATAGSASCYSHRMT